MIEDVRPDIYVKGGDYTIEAINFAGMRFCIAIKFSRSVSGISATSIIEKLRVAS